jgi:hypothetical protein
VKTKVSTITLLGLSVALFVVGCGTSTDKTTKETSTTTYVPAPPPQVIVQAPPVAVIPPTTSTTTSMSNDRSSDTTKSGFGSNGTEQNTSIHHSESTTVTPSN